MNTSNRHRHGRQLGRSPRLLLGASLLVLGACSSEGFTPDCPPLELYDVREEPEKCSSDEREEAVERGCVSRVDTTTPPEANGAAGSDGD
jgi:hypothetical protein